MVAAEALAARESRSGAIGRPLFDWIEPLFKGRNEGRRRLRLVACHLADIGWREHPDYRAVQTFNRLLRFPFAGLAMPSVHSWPMSASSAMAATRASRRSRRSMG